MRAASFIACRDYRAKLQTLSKRLLAQRRHRFRRRSCLLSEAQRTSLIGWPLSANDPKRIAEALRSLLVLAAFRLVPYDFRLWGAAELIGAKEILSSPMAGGRGVRVGNAPEISFYFKNRILGVWVVPSC